MARKLRGQYPDAIYHPMTPFSTAGTGKAILWDDADRQQSRQEAVMTLKWIAQRLQMGRRHTLANGGRREDLPIAGTDTFLCGMLCPLALAATSFHVAPPPLTSDTSPGTEAQPFATIQEGVDTAAEGDTVVVAPAVGRFLSTDWSRRPLFAPGSPLSLTEDQFKALPATRREAKAAEITSQADALKELAGAVAQAGRDAAAKKDLALARKHSTALRQFGEALDTTSADSWVELTVASIGRVC